MEDRVTGVRYSADTLKQGKPARRDRVNPQPTPGVYPQRASTQSVVIMYLHGSPRYKLVDDDIVQDEDDGAPGALPGVLPHDDEVVYRGGLKALREGAASSFSVEARSFECGKLNLSPKGNFALVSRELLGEKTNPNGPHKPHFENCGRRVYAWWENAHTSAWIIGSAENSVSRPLRLLHISLLMSMKFFIIRPHADVRIPLRSPALLSDFSRRKTLNSTSASILGKISASLKPIWRMVRFI